MNQAIQEEWLRRLRSGLYKQGHTKLKYETDEGTRHCCLGILCEMAKEAGIVNETLSHSIFNQTLSNNMLMFSSVLDPTERNDSYPTRVVREWAETTIAEMRFFAVLNDTGRTFDQIAQAIEDHEHYKAVAKELGE